MRCISSCTTCRISARRARRQVRTINTRAATVRNAQMMAVCTATWVARHSAGRLATELITPTAGLAKPNTPPGALTCTLPRWLTGSQRWSLKCSSEQTAIRAEDSASPTAPLRTTSDGAGRRHVPPGRAQERQRETDRRGEDDYPDAVFHSDPSPVVEVRQYRFRQAGIHRFLLRRRLLGRLQLPVISAISAKDQDQHQDCPERTLSSPHRSRWAQQSDDAQQAQRRAVVARGAATPPPGPEGNLMLICFYAHYD